MSVQRLFKIAACKSNFDIIRSYGKHTSILPSHQIARVDVSFNQCKWYSSAKSRKAPKEVTLIKKKPIADVWNEMTIEQIAKTLDQNVDYVKEAVLTQGFPGRRILLRNDFKVYDLELIMNIVKTCGKRPHLVSVPGKEDGDKNEIKDIIRQPPPDPELLVKRPPVVTIMGHVDHGKTTLLDSLRQSRIVDSEFGGITQHIGAFSVNTTSGEKITFIDTPGHAAFHQMRSRGAEVTDIVVLVVAADDGVMEQTVESIKMALAARVSIIVAINKIDKPNADVERTKQTLLNHGIQLEQQGGDVQAVPISALKKTNLNVLIESILLEAEVKELKGDPHGMVEGVIIESRVDRHRGKLSTTLVKRGTLNVGKVLVAGTAWAKVRAMYDESGKQVKDAGPSTPVQIIGWREVPLAGEEVIEVKSEKEAHACVRWREKMQLSQKQKQDQVVIEQKAQEHHALYREKLEKKWRERQKRPVALYKDESKKRHDDEGPTLRVLVKADVCGSVEAIVNALGTYNDSRCKFEIVHHDVGSISVNDIELAELFNAIVYCFNISNSRDIEDLAQSKNVQIRHHNIIYHLIDDMKDEMTSRLPPLDEDEIIGEAVVLQYFSVTEKKKKVPVAGCKCVQGILKRDSKFRVLRNNEVIYDGSLTSMRHFKEEVLTIKKDTECGLMFADHDGEFMPDDKIICYNILKVNQKINWNPGF